MGRSNGAPGPVFGALEVVRGFSDPAIVVRHKPIVGAHIDATPRVCAKWRLYLSLFRPHARKRREELKDAPVIDKKSARRPKEGIREGREVHPYQLGSEEFEQRHKGDAHQMRLKAMPSLSMTDTVPRARFIARKKDVCVRSSTISPARLCWLLACAQTQ